MSKVSERDRIQALEAKLKQLKTLQTRREARARTTAAKKSRGEELRRKILAGAVLLSKVEAGEFQEATLKAWMEPSAPPLSCRRLQTRSSTRSTRS